MSLPSRLLTCSMCGHTFDPADQACCLDCPLNSGCTLVRCPVCGFETADPNQSGLARLFNRLFLKPGTRQAPLLPNWHCTLADVSPGSRAEVGGFLPGLSSERQAHLHAYGLAPGIWVQVKQQRPVTVILVDQTEIALEAELACQIRINQVAPR